MYTILLVDDSHDVRKMLSGLVLKHFKDVIIVEAADGVEANAAIAEQLPDLILMDVGLPGTNGIELTKQIKEKYSNLPIAIFTNHDYPEYKKKAFENGADFYLSKKDSTEKDIVHLIQNKKTPTTRH